MNYKDYNIEDFLSDEDFVHWIKDPNHVSATKWNLLINRHPEKLALVKEAKQIISSANYAEKVRMDKKDYNDILQQLEGEILKQNQETVNARSNSIFSRKYMSIAASIAATLVVSLGILFSDKILPSENSIALQKPEFIIKSTPKGQKSIITLQDGSIVKLNAESSLKIPKTFSTETKRIVYLEGEAFFEVKRDKNRPFQIYTGDVVTEVLGTSFNIKAYEQEEKIEVAVATGKVKINNKVNNQFQVLIPKEKVTVTDGEINKTTFDFRKDLGWKENIIHFKDAEFEEVTQILERWYGVDFIIDKNVHGEFNGTFKNLSLSDVLEGINYMSEFEFNIENDTVYIK